MNDTKTKTSKTYIDRDLDWLLFNKRVLEEAEDNSNSIANRLKFLAIFSSNLDEFFRVRVSKLRQIKGVKKKIRKPLALKPNKKLKAILKKVDELQDSFGKVYRTQILPELKRNGIHLIDIDNCSIEQVDFLKELFDSKIKSEIKILSDDLSINQFDNGQLYSVIEFTDTNELSFLSIPTTTLPRFIKLPSAKNEQDIVFLEDVIKQFSEELFPNKSINSQYLIKVSKDAELYLEDEYDGPWLEQIYEALAKRQHGQPTRCLFEKHMPNTIQKSIRKHLGLGKIDMIEGGKCHNFSDFISFPVDEDFGEPKKVNRPALNDTTFLEAEDIFQVIRKKDKLFHFPYQSYSHVEHFVEQSAIDAKVKSIYISLYRVAKESRLSDALLLALKNGKEVVIFVETKARFDEHNNLKWAKIFEEHGAEVHYSFKHLKVHSKIFLVERQEANKLQGYGYIGTGNFNAKTAKIYCDHGLFIARAHIIEDLRQVFKVLRRENVNPKFNELIVSPFNSRMIFQSLIRNEIEVSKSGGEAKITAKMNSLEDKQMIDQLCKASQFGVEVRLIVRGFCCLDLSNEEASKHIKITSILDDFLEHGRVYLFHNGGEELMYFGSADWMTRNLDKRIEVLTPILDSDIFTELKDIVEIQCSDNVKARERLADNTYIYVNNDESKVRSQHAIYNYLEAKL
tara:strand:+ start:37968 stop:40010 length:2043 start_codon:yes stop_codon:yes gene_type:complete